MQKSYSVAGTVSIQVKENRKGIKRKEEEEMKTKKKRTK